MAAEITLFTKYDVLKGAQVIDASSVFDQKTATFTASKYCYARVYANGADVKLTIATFQFTVPSGTVETFALESGTAVAVA